MEACKSTSCLSTPLPGLSVTDHGSCSHAINHWVWPAHHHDFEAITRPIKKTPDISIVRLPMHIRISRSHTALGKFVFECFRRR